MIANSSSINVQKKLPWILKRGNISTGEKQSASVLDRALFSLPLFPLFPLFCLRWSFSHPRSHSYFSPTMVTVYFLSTPPLRWLLYLFLSIPISPSILRFPRSVYRCPYLSKIFKMFLCSTLSFSFSWDRHFDGVTFTWSGTDALEPFSSLPLLSVLSEKPPSPLPFPQLCILS